MKKMIVFLGLIFSFALQAETPAETNCIRSGGKVKTLNIQMTKPSQQKFCYFDSAGMEVETFSLSQFMSSGGPDANKAYRDTPQADYMACEKRGGKKYFARDEAGFQSDVCIFFDRSAIDERTLESGMSSPWNQKLNDALGIF